MPTYEYACQSCGRHVEVFQRFSEDSLTTCEVCGGPLRKVFHPAGILFKGSGFYATDSRRSGARSGDKEDGKKGGEAGEKGEKRDAGAKASESSSGSSGSEASSSGSSSTGDGSLGASSKGESSKGESSKGDTSKSTEKSA